MSDILETARRFFEIVEKTPIDADTFSFFDVWVHVQQVLALEERKADLPPAAVNVLSELGERLSIPVGSPPPVIGRAIEENFGSCPYGEEVLVRLTQYIRAQLNSFTEAEPRKGPSLSGEPDKKSDVAPQWPEKKLW